MIVSRRQVLKAIPAGFAGLFIPGLAAAANALAAEPSRLIVGSEKKIIILDIASRQVLQSVNIWFAPHSFVRHPENPDRIWTIQRDPNYKNPGGKRDLLSPQAVEIDMRTGEITQRIVPAVGSEFRGHACIPRGGNIIFIARVDNTTGLGHLTGYDTRTGKPVADHIVAQGSIHDTQLADDGTVFVANTGFAKKIEADGKVTSSRLAKGGIVHFDLAGDKVLNDITTDDNDQYIGHFCMLKNGKFYAGSNADEKGHEPGVIYVGHRDGKVLTPVQWKGGRNAKKPSEMFGLTVSQDQKTVAVSNYKENALYAVDTASDTVIDKVTQPMPFGVVYDRGNRGFVSFGTTFSLLDNSMHLKETIALKSGGKPLTFTSGHALLI